MAASTGLRVAAEAAPQMRPNSAGADPTVSPTTLPIQNASTPALSSAATSACKSAVSSAPSCAKGVRTAGITPLIANSGIGESEFITAGAHGQTVSEGIPLPYTCGMFRFRLEGDCGPATSGRCTV